MEFESETCWDNLSVDTGEEEVAVAARAGFVKDRFTVGESKRSGNRRKRAKDSVHLGEEGSGTSGHSWGDDAVGGG